MLSRRTVYLLIIALLISMIILFLVNLVWFRPVFIGPFFYKELYVALKKDPQLASSLKAPYLYRKSRDRLNDISPEAIAERMAHLDNYSAMLAKYNTRYLSRQNRLSLELIRQQLVTERELLAYPFHDYPLNPYNGLQIDLLYFLDSYHTVSNKKEAKAYLSRLAQIPVYLDQLKQRVERSEEAGTLPPAYLLQQTADQLEQFLRIDPENHSLFLSFKQKLDSLPRLKGKEKILEEALHLLNEDVYPAYRDLLEYTRSLRPDAPRQIGVAHLPEGNAYYQRLLEKHTGLHLPADTLYRMGIDETLRVREELIAALAQWGMASNRRNVIDKVRDLAQSGDHIPGNTIQGRIRCRELIDSVMKQVPDEMDAWFKNPPSAGWELRKVPVFLEHFAPAACYHPPDSRRRGNKGIIHFNMAILDEMPEFELPTLTYHLIYPGHHLQLAGVMENRSLPIYRKRIFNPGLVGGWGLYAEHLMWESGYYNQDPQGNLGRLNAELFQSARMVTDIGIHTKQWSRENAISFMKKNTVLSDSRIRTEVDRIVASPAKGCSPAAGFLTLLQLREKMEKALGQRFDAREFHDLILRDGILSFEQLDEQIDRFISGKNQTDEEK
jgi:uncharacterized protein (DUF885 family)